MHNSDSSILETIFDISFPSPVSSQDQIIRKKNYEIPNI